MQERIKAFRDIAALLRVHAQNAEPAIAAWGRAMWERIEQHADGMAADVAAEQPTSLREIRARHQAMVDVCTGSGLTAEQAIVGAIGQMAHKDRGVLLEILGAASEQPPMPSDKREALARDLYERMRGHACRTKTTTPIEHAWWCTLVDVIGEIERGRHPLHVLTVAPDGSQTVRVVPEGWQPLTKRGADAWACDLLERLPLPASEEPNTCMHGLADALLASNRGEIPSEVRRQGAWWHPFTPGMASDALCSFCGKTAGEHTGVPVADLARAHMRPLTDLERRAMAANLPDLVPAAEHPRDHVELDAAIAQGQRDVDEATALAYGTWRPGDDGAYLADALTKAGAGQRGAKTDDDGSTFCTACGDVLLDGGAT